MVTSSLNNNLTLALNSGIKEKNVASAAMADGCTGATGL